MYPSELLSNHLRIGGVSPVSAKERIVTAAELVFPRDGFQGATATCVVNKTFYSRRVVSIQDFAHSQAANHAAQANQDSARMKVLACHSKRVSRLSRRSKCKISTAPLRN